MMNKRIVLGELETKILDVLWKRKEATAAEITADLPEDSARHYNTVATVLQRLSEKELVGRKRDGRNWVYRPLVSREEIARQYLSMVKEEIYGGSFAKLVAALLTPGKKPGRSEKKIAEALTKMARSRKRPPRG